MTTKKQNQTGESIASRVNYGKQCEAFNPESHERCSMCDGHPSEHKFPMTDKIAKLIEVLDMNVRASRYDVGSAKASLLEMCTSIERKMQQVKQYIANGNADCINELGELQSRGPEFDRLCAKFRIRQDELKNAERMLARAKGEQS